MSIVCWSVDAAGVGGLAVSEGVGHRGHEGADAAVDAVFGLGLRVVGQGHARGPVEHVIHGYRGRNVVERLVERGLGTQRLRGGVICLGHAAEGVVHVPAAHYHHVLRLRRAPVPHVRHGAVLLHLHGPAEAVDERHGLDVVAGVLDVVVPCHGVCRRGDAALIGRGFRLVLEGYGVWHARGQLVRPADCRHAAEVVDVGLVVEVVQVATLQGDAVAVVEVGRLAAVPEGVGPCSTYMFISGS